METSDLITIILVIVNSVGLFLFVVNSLYLLCIGEKLRTALLCKSEKDFEDSDEKRCCKVSSSKACSLVLFYHLVLIAAEVIVAIVSFTDAAFWNEDINFDVVFSDKPMGVGTVLFFAAAVNYIVSMLYTIPFVLVPLARKSKRINNIGKLVTYNMFSFYNFLVFWGLIYIIIQCRKSDICLELPAAFQITGRHYLAAILVVIVYVIMLVEAGVLQQYIIVSPFGNRTPPTDEVSKDKAVEIMKNKTKEAPYITWTIRCPGEKQCCDSSHNDSCNEERVFTFENSKNWIIDTPQGSPSTEDFNILATHLCIQVSVSLEDQQVQKDIAPSRDQFELEHLTHNDPVSITTQSHFIHNYLVQDISARIIYWSFAILGLSFPYRLFLYMGIRRNSYQIIKRVYARDVSAMEQDFPEDSVLETSMTLEP